MGVLLILHFTICAHTYRLYPYTYLTIMHAEIRINKRMQTKDIVVFVRYITHLLCQILKTLNDIWAIYSGRFGLGLGVAISDSHHLEGVSKKNQQKPLKILGSS